MMKLIRAILGIAFSVSLIIVLLFTSVEIVACGIPGYFHKEFTKYNVYEATATEPEELDRVAKEMMDYLVGKREKMSDIKATVNEIPDTTFFNEQECAHMEDVRALFLGGIRIRKQCLLLCAVILLILLVTSGLKKTIDTISRGIIRGTLLFVVAIIVLAILLVKNFNKYFTLFHQIFFTNDLWLFDPRTSRMINMLPEGFFSDTALNIILVFAVMLVILLLLATGHEKKRNK